ncbi:hypothetical protein XH98_23400 [Bradyrhizobium sp. CCBAU 51745]|nr:hypothetical protein [Bradyrhizobium sp. CCBAU 45384]MDA9441979.1 hypothetical protein [Bradyrhizobium sp. CCBAU 51745]
MRVSPNRHLKMAVVAVGSRPIYGQILSAKGYYGFLRRNKILALDIGAETIDPDRMRRHEQR